MSSRKLRDQNEKKPHLILKGWVFYTISEKKECNQNQPYFLPTTDFAAE